MKLVSRGAIAPCRQSIKKKKKFKEKKFLPQNPKRNERNSRNARKQEKASAPIYKSKFKVVFWNSKPFQGMALIFCTGLYLNDLRYHTKFQTDSWRRKKVMRDQSWKFANFRKLDIFCCKFRTHTSVKTFFFSLTHSTHTQRT